MYSWNSTCDGLLSIVISHDIINKSEQANYDVSVNSN